MNAKSPCQHCGVSIEFEADNFEPGITSPCPACGRETELFLKLERREPFNPVRTQMPAAARRIEDDLDEAAVYAGRSAFPRFQG